MRQDEGCPCHPEEEEVEAGEEHCSGEAVILFVQNCLENIQDKDFFIDYHIVPGVVQEVLCT